MLELEDFTATAEAVRQKIAGAGGRLRHDLIIRDALKRAYDEGYVHGRASPIDVVHEPEKKVTT